jgi:maleate isomerase
MIARVGLIIPSSNRERPDADAYFISCANISIFGVIEELEARLDRPIVTSNQAVMWDALRRIGRRDRRPCRGRLFERTIADEAPRRTG